MGEDRLVALLKAYAASDKVRRQWPTILETGVQMLLARPLDEVVPPATFATAVDEVLTEDQLVSVARLSTQLVLSSIVDEIMQTNEDPAEEAPLSAASWIPAEAQARLEAIVTRDGLVDEDWVDVVVAQAATRELFAETLIQGLDDFSELIPQLIQGFAPPALSRLAMRFQEAAGGVTGRFKEEAKNRFEPEIRQFAHRATQSLLEGTAQSVKARLDEPSSKEARLNLFRHALSRPASSYASVFTPQTREDLEAALVATAKSESFRARVRAQLIQVYEELRAHPEGTSLQALITAHQIPFKPNYEAWADITWPAVQIFLQSSGVEQFWTELVRALHQELSEFSSSH